ncbi:MULTISPECIES: NAD(P)/FAD-dependent oxidoreductase [unclassified Streptomyces]|uniref:NAD(P)/FAD-dependent oxidoreductase n=1 Tax=unclassified Streptomyces TaxID=2593676 RepID=UPI000F6C4BBB|nr:MULTISPECIES: FAD-binding oxidoreductase [unclassified Streptomyces]AZM61095.1 FAD-dependent oxidoreductase [Streptomyces sp. WAC 01438]RSM97834.1 FAD-dependent oxidoreductase [Streptomyces sp. WAC 01420]
MKQIPYWLDTAPALPDRSGKDLPDEADVVVIGGGLTGLSTAYHAARKGARVVLVEKDKVGSGASGRNGSMCTQGLTIGVGEARRRYGRERARELYDAFREAVDVVEELTRRERIDCDFHRPGRLGVAFKPGHFTSMRATQRDLAENFGHETRLLTRAELKAELGSDYYHGALLDPLSAALHVGKYVHGLAGAAERAGAQIHERNAATGLTRLPGGGFAVETLNGTVRARQVMAATDAYTDKALPWFRKRLINVGSFIIVTEPLGEARAKELIPNGRLVVDSKNVGHYIRLTPDHRLAFGGRARFAPSNPASDVRSGDILTREMTEIFPQLAGVRVDYVWGGMVGFSWDRLPHAGEAGGLYYSMGYCGHGVQMATYMGRAVAEMMDGKPEANPLRGLGFPKVPVPFYNGTPWFLPLGGAYYRAKDRLR